MTAAEPSIAELVRQVAEAKGYREESGSWRYPDGKLRFRLNIADPARLWELEGELFKEEIYTYFVPERNVWLCRVGNSVFKEPGTPEGRVRLILRATLEMNGGKVV